jgi:cell division protein FtsB
LLLFFAFGILAFTLIFCIIFYLMYWRNWQSMEEDRNSKFQVRTTRQLYDLKSRVSKLESENRRLKSENAPLRDAMEAALRNRLRA